MNNLEQEHLYEFRGERFLCDEKTILILNYALALNHAQDRYKKVEK